MRFVNGKIVYKCDVCGVEGVKLWREYSTFLDHQSLYCLNCANKNQGKNAIPYDDKKVSYLGDMWQYRTEQDIKDGWKRDKRWRLGFKIEDVPVDAAQFEKEVLITDTIGWLVPAALTVEMDTFWGYTSVPQDRCEWWYNLPYFPKEKKKTSTGQDLGFGPNVYIPLG
jgi:hypothetical protein